MENWMFGLFSFRRLDATQQLVEESPELAPYIAGFVISLWVMVFVVNKFSDWINRK